MSNEQQPNRCPKCQAPLPSDAPQGLCAKCLLEAVATPTDAGQPHEKSPPPPIHAVVAAFPQLEIIEVIGHGGMGIVYKARQPKLDRFVALKLLSESLAAEPAFAERFAREARMLARLNHPNIVNVYDYGQANGFYYLLMEYVDGINLRQALQAGRFTPPQALSLVPKICEALQFAHDEGILHRDIKPENILLDSRGRIKIADFGIAKLLVDKADENILTATGSAIGTPQYMAPEQLEHRKDIDQRADIYSLGVVFYELLTGELPIGRFAPPSHKSTVDPRVDEVVMRTLEKEREKRFGSAGEVKSEVEHITGTEPAPPLTASATVRSSKCYLSTRERMRHCFHGPRAQIFYCRGQLELTKEQLKFTSPWSTTLTLPLADIEDVTVGQFKLWQTPWLMKFEQFNFISIRLKTGQSYSLEPVPENLASAEVNSGYIAEWCQAIRQTVLEATGAAPKTSPPTSVSINARPVWARRLLYVLLAAVLGWLGLPVWLSTIMTIGLSAAIIWFCAGFLLANNALKKGDLDAVTSNEPPPNPTGPGGTQLLAGQNLTPRRTSPWLKWVGWIALVIFGIPTLILLIFLIWITFKPHAKTGVSGPPEAVLEPAKTSDVTRYPGLKEFRWRYTVPAGHVATFTYLTASNGIINFVEPLSSWIAGRPDKSTKGTIQWNVQAGSFLSPELLDQERWDSKREVIESGRSSGASGNVWMRIHPDAMEVRNPNMVRLQTNQTRELLFVGNTNNGISIEMRLSKLPPGFAARLKSLSSDGTNWMSLLSAEKEVNK